MEPSHNWWYFVKITCSDVISIVCCTQTKLEFLSIAENVKVPFLLYKVLSGNLPFITSSFVMYYVHTRCHNHIPGFGHCTWCILGSLFSLDLFCPMCIIGAKIRIFEHCRKCQGAVFIVQGAFRKPPIYH